LAVVVLVDGVDDHPGVVATEELVHIPSLEV
jgi:hypothetical protein